MLHPTSRLDRLITSTEAQQPVSRIHAPKSRYLPSFRLDGEANMPDPNLQAYLAAHYLSGPKADAILARSSDGTLKRKKKKPKSDTAEAPSSATGIVFKDDEDAWKAAPGEEEDEDGLTPQVVGRDAGPSKAFKKIGSSKSHSVDDDASAQAGPSTQPAPASAPAEGPTEFRAGLRTKEEMKAARLAREERRQREAEQAAHSQPASDTAAAEEEDEEARLAQETVYRDSSGRIIDVRAAEAEALAQERARQRKDAERKTRGQGLVQKQQQKAEKAQLESVQRQSVARRATDQDYNDHFKQQERADDPALAFLTKKRVQGPQKPKYKGPYPPNRFNIAPGYRWDGVDRGNGFEKLLFERKSKLARREQEARAWGQSDM